MATKDRATRTIKFRIKDKETCRLILSFLTSAAHLRNMLIILIKKAYQHHKDLYFLSLKADILRAVLFERPGGKKASVVNKFLLLSKKMPQEDQLMLAGIITLAKTFDAKHIYKLTKTLIGEMKGFFTKINKDAGSIAQMFWYQWP